MEAALRQSKAMCPFMKNASPAKLRALSTSARPKAPSPCGGTMSRLQTYAHRCPVMGKALTMQAAQGGRSPVAGAGAGASLFGGIRAFSGQAKSGKARIHTSSSHEARAVEGNVMNGRDQGMFRVFPAIGKKI